MSGWTFFFFFFSEVLGLDGYMAQGTTLSVRWSVHGVQSKRFEQQVSIFFLFFFITLLYIQQEQ